MAEIVALFAFYVTHVYLVSLHCSRYSSWLYTLYLWCFAFLTRTQSPRYYAHYYIMSLCSRSFVYHTCCKDEVDLSVTSARPRAVTTSLANCRILSQCYCHQHHHHRTARTVVIALALLLTPFLPQPLFPSSA